MSTSKTANLIFINGDIHTMDTERPKAEALAIQGEYLVAVGDNETILEWKGEHSRVIDLSGKTLTPGLVDSHCHLYGLGSSMESVNLRGLTSEADAAKAVAKANQDSSEGWVRGRGWDQTLWADKSFPARQSLDAYFPDRPVALNRVDGHAIWVNSKALELAGIDDSTVNPEGGEIVRDAQGKATGVLVDNAMDSIFKLLKSPDKATIRQRILRAAQRASSLGLTGVHEMSISLKVAEVYQELEDEGLLPLRVYAYLHGEAPLSSKIIEKKPETSPEDNEHFILRGVKLFADGALGSRGATLLQDYSDKAGHKGLWVTNPDDLHTVSKQLADKGWQLAVHAIGDAANRVLLDAFEAAYEKHPESDLRFRVEHAQILTEVDIPRFGKSGIIASIQPTHGTSDMRWAEKRIGAERIRFAYAWQSLAKTGAVLAGGSDFPVEKVSPLLGLYSAVTRQDHQGLPEEGWYAEEKLSFNQALASFTTGAAYASFREKSLGKLAPGYLADITVYDRKLQPDATLLQSQIDMSIVGGAVRFEGR